MPWCHGTVPVDLFCNINGQMLYAFLNVAYNIMHWDFPWGDCKPRPRSSNLIVLSSNRWFKRLTTWLFFCSSKADVNSNRWSVRLITWLFFSSSKVDVESLKEMHSTRAPLLVLWFLKEMWLLPTSRVSDSLVPESLFNNLEVTHDPKNHVQSILRESSSQIC